MIDLSVIVSAHHINDGVKKNLKEVDKHKHKVKDKEKDMNLKEGDDQHKDQPDIDHLDVGGLGKALGDRDEHCDQHQHHSEVHDYCGLGRAVKQQKSVENKPQRKMA